MATMTYKQYLKKTGKTSTAAAARMWDRLYNDNKRFGTGTPAAPAAPKPEFDFGGPLDLQGTEAQTNLDFAKRTQESALDTDYNAGISELDAADVDLGYQRDEGFRSADSNAAGRGLSRSGIRETNRGRVLRDYIQGQGDISRGRTDLVNQRQRGFDILNADYLQNRSNIRNESIARRYQKWREQGGGF